MPIHDTVQARKFELVGEEDQVRVSLEQHDGGFITMRFFDVSGRLKLNVGLGQNGMPNVSLNAEDGNPRLAMVVEEDGSASINGWNSNNGDATQCFQVSILADGSASNVRFFDNQGKVRTVIGIMNGNGAVALLNANGQVTHGFAQQ